MKIPKFNGLPLFGIGTRADASGGFLWFRRDANGVHILESAAVVKHPDEYLVDEWLTYEEWVTKGMTPGSTTVRIFEASLGTYRMRSAFDVSVLLGEAGLKDQGIFGRNIYLICLRPKIRLVPGSLALLVDGRVTGQLFVASFTVGAVSTLNASEPQMFDTQNVPIEFTTSSESGGDTRRVTAIEWQVPTAAAFRLDDGTITSASVWNMAHLANITPGLPLKIVYIGQSKRIEQRLVRHEKIQRALAAWSDDHDVMVMVCQFNEPTVTVGASLPKLIEITRADTKLISDARRLDLVEKALISHFGPVLNVLEKDSPIKNKRSVAATLEEAKYSKVLVDFEPQPRVTIGSDSRPGASRHTIEENFEHLKTVFSEHSELDVLKELLESEGHTVD